MGIIVGSIIMLSWAVNYNATSLPTDPLATTAPANSTTISQKLFINKQGESKTFSLKKRCLIIVKFANIILMPIRKILIYGICKILKMILLSKISIGQGSGVRFYYRLNS